MYGIYLTGVHTLQFLVTRHIRK